MNGPHLPSSIPIVIVAPDPTVAQGTIEALAATMEPGSAETFGDKRVLLFHLIVNPDIALASGSLAPALGLVDMHPRVAASGADFIRKYG